MRWFAALAAVLLLSACAAEAPPPPAVPHGYVEGAEETAEAQSRLVIADESGAVRVLDLVTEEVTELDSVGKVDAISGDGRYAYLTTGDTVHVIDSGGWTVDHGDHVHYYRSKPRVKGTVPPNEVPHDEGTDVAPEAPKLTLTPDGVLHAHDSATGAELASRPLLTLPTGTPVIEVDRTRAYVNDPAARKVHEIDYNDNLRVARTFSLDITPAYMVETGR